jgi:Fe-S cluster biogenesis protein NfuA
MNQELFQQVAQFIRERIEPAFAFEGGSLELVDVSDGIAQIRFRGACASCPSTISALILGLEQELRARFPDTVKFIEAVP